jgi:ABC-type phosphate transport system substrate-binding protein
MRTVARVATVCGVVVLALAAPQRVSAQLAVVVNHENPIQNIRVEDLRRIYLGQTSTFPDGQAVVLVEFPARASLFYEKLLGMSNDLFRRHWIALVFRGGDLTPPQAIASAELLKQFVADHAGAIAFIDLAMADTRVKVLKVDDLPPTDPRYRLAMKERTTP